MRKLGVILLICGYGCIADIHAQAPNYGSVARDTLAGVAPNNPWLKLGAQFGYKFAGNSDFADGLLASSRLELDRLEFPDQSTRLGLPLIGNLSKLSAGTPADSFGGIISKLINTAEGMNIGFYPYYELDNSGAVRFTVYGSTVYKLNAGKDISDSSTVALHQGRFTFGLGMDLYVAASDKSRPISLSFEPVFTFVDRDAFQRVSGVSLNRISSIELTGIVPVGPHLGFLSQYAAPDAGKSLFRIGLIYTPKSKAATEEKTTGGTAQAAVTPPAVPSPPAAIKMAIEGHVIEQVAPNGWVNDAVVEAQVYPNGVAVSGACTVAGASWQPAKTDVTEGTGFFQVDGDVASAPKVCVQVKVTKGARTVTLGEVYDVPAASAAVHTLVLRPILLP